MPKVLVEFTKTGFCVDPHVCRLDNEVNVSDELRIAFITCKSYDKDAALLHVIHHIQSQQQDSHDGNDREKEKDTSSSKSKKKKKNKDDKVNKKTEGLTLIFAATRHHVEYITTLLNNSSSGEIATLVYGTLDQEARRHNIASFRSGKKPIMVVTDVAARGIDIPLIDHVIHYSFPPSAKLFVHRSGRAARAGRIGYCWSLVEPDELPYMIDLHLFLGRKPTTGINAAVASNINLEKDDKGDYYDSSSNNNDNNATSDEFTYTLKEMTPDMVHYGSVPESVLVEEVENVRRIMDAELTGSQDAQALKSLTRTCNNAMKQYRRSRPEASKEGVRRAKAILEGEKLDSGQRVNGGGSIPSHPLLRGMELVDYERRKAKGIVVDGGLNDIDNVKKREDFLQALSSFRPSETIFEAFATGGGKETSVVSHIDKGRTTSSTGKKNDTSHALLAMKSMRRQMKMARDKGSTLVVAGSTNAQMLNGDAEYDDHCDSDDDNMNDEGEQGPKTKSNTTTSSSSSANQPAKIESKKRLSKAERKRLKKGGGSVSSIKTNHDSNEHQSSSKSKNKRGADFRDGAFFIDNNYSEYERQREAAMQPSASTNNKGAMGTALRIEEAMMDIVGDENNDLIQNQRMMRWDKSKRKYVQTSVGAELSGDSKSKRLRLESGQLIKSDKMKLGEMYEKWQKKTNKSVGRTGVFDDAGDDGDGTDAATITTGGKKNRKGKGGGKQQQQFNNDDGTKSADQIKKDRDKKSDMKLKNMKKGDRRRLEQRNSKSSSSTSGNNPKGYQGKKGKSGRWSSNVKKRR